MRRFALVVTSHRGDLYLPETLEIARKMLPSSITYCLLHDDAGGAGVYPGTIPLVQHQRVGLAGAVSSAWAALAEIPEPVDFVFHLEEDFHLLEPVDLDGMADAIEQDGLANMVLLRQPALTPEEQAADGFLNIRPERFEQRDGYLFHREGFWLNPCLIPADVIRQGGGDEAHLTALHRDRGFGICGQRDDPPRCLHVGLEGGMGSEGWKG